MIELLGLPPNAAVYGGEVDRVIVLMHILMAILFVGWGTFFIFALIKFRKSRNPKANYQGVKSHASSYLEITVAIIEAVILIAFSIPIWAKRVNAFPPEKDSVVVKVVAQQFSWNFHYAGPDGKFGNTQPQYVNDQSNPVGLDSNDPHAMDDITTRVMVLPVQKPAIVHLTSKDVIHSFGVPLLRVKHDMIPGMSIPLWFIPKETGQFEIVCSQLCGVGHARMKGVIQVKTQEEFDTWLSQQSPTLSASEDEAW